MYLTDTAIRKICVESQEEGPHLAKIITVSATDLTPLLAHTPGRRVIPLQIIST
jgi:hypothetical protein